MRLLRSQKSLARNDTQLKTGGDGNTVIPVGSLDIQRPKQRVVKPHDGISKQAELISEAAAQLIFVTSQSKRQHVMGKPSFPTKRNKRSSSPTGNIDGGIKRPQISILISDAQRVFRGDAVRGIQTHVRLGEILGGESKFET